MVSAELNSEKLLMDGREFYTRRRRVSAKPVYSARALEANSPKKTPQVNLPAEPSPRARELLRLARRDINQLDERKRASDSVKAEAEFELSEAAQTVKDLTTRIEESNLRVKSQMRRLRKTRLRDEPAKASITKKTENYEYAEVMKELDYVKKELSKLKLDMASVIEQKQEAEKETQASISKMSNFSGSVDTLMKEIEEVNEEQVLVELARIEAAKELGDIENQRKEEEKQYSVALEETRKKMNDMIKEIDHAKVLEMKLATTVSDVDMLQSELKLIREMDKGVQRSENSKPPELTLEKEDDIESQSSLNLVVKELEAAKKELASIREEGFQFMASMDIIRDELKHVSEEKARVQKLEEKSDATVQNLNCKLLRANAKLESASAAEENSKSIVSNILISLVQLKMEAEEAKKEKEELSDETLKLKTDINKTEAEINIAEERVQAAVLELEAVKSSETEALENLKNLAESIMSARVSPSQHTSKIAISAFEYEYLTGRARGAEELADKKVAAAQAWIEALKASENEIQLKIEIAQKEIEDLKEEKGADVIRTKRSLSTKRAIEGESIGRAKREKNMEPARNSRSEAGFLKRSMNRSGKGTPMRQAKIQRSSSPAVMNTPRSTSFTIRRRRKVIPNLAKLFTGKGNQRNN